MTYYTLSGVGFDKEDKEDLINKCEGVDKVVLVDNIIVMTTPSPRITRYFLMKWLWDGCGNSVSWEYH